MHSEYCIPVSNGNAVYKTYNNKMNTGTVLFDDGQFVTNDGMLVLIENSISAKRVFITVDVNGYKKRPNRWGHDLFTFEIDSKGHLLPMGVIGTRFYDVNDLYCSLEDRNIWNGAGCTYKALNDKTYFNSLPK